MTCAFRLVLLLTQATNSMIAAPTHKDAAAAQESRRTTRRSKCFARTMYGALVFILLAAPTMEAATTEAPTTEALYDFVDVANCRENHKIVTAQECKAAADALGIHYNRESMNGHWKATPPGCFVHKGCTHDCKLHFGMGGGNNNGNFR